MIQQPEKNTYEIIQWVTGMNPSDTLCYRKNGKIVYSTLLEYMNEKNSELANLREFEQSQNEKEMDEHFKELGARFDAQLNSAKIRTDHIIKSLPKIKASIALAKQNPSEYFAGWFDVNGGRLFVAVHFEKSIFNYIRKFFTSKRKSKIIFNLALSHYEVYEYLSEKSLVEDLCQEGKNK